MPLGITPARGPWDKIRSPITSLAQGAFQKGDLVTTGVGRLVSLHTASNNTMILGVATHDSGNSLPAGFAIIAYPVGANCTAYVDTLPTETRSNLSFGESGSIVSFGGRTSTFSKLATSVWSRTVTIRTADQPINSADSRIEVVFTAANVILASASSASLLV